MKATIITLAAQYARLIYWSVEDACYIGSLPEICGPCCHGDSVEELYPQLDTIAQEWVEKAEAGECSLPPPGNFAVINKSRYSLSADVRNSIARLRRSLGLSQADFAAALGVSLSSVGQWEQGRRRPDGASARLLSIIEKHPELVSE